MSTLAWRQEYYRNHKWLRHLDWAKKRCKDLNHSHCKKGVQFKLTKIEIEMLWHRDGADTMVRPSLERDNPDGDYTYDNCCFMEWIMNVSRRRPRGTVGRGIPDSEVALVNWS